VLATTKFTLICSTLGTRRKDLERLLESLVCQTYKNIEMIIVHQNKSNCILDLINRYKHLIDIKYISTEERGLSLGRNIGFKIASGEIIGFPDDDCWYPCNFFERMLKCFFDNDIVITIIKDPLKNLIYPLHKRLKVRKMIKKPSDVIMGLSVGIFVKRAVLKKMEEKYGYIFDENIGAGTKYGSGEETDFLIRAYSLGCRIELVPSIQVFHAVGINYGKDYYKIRTYARGIGYLLKKYKEIWIIFLWLKTLMRALMASIIRSLGDKNAFRYYLNKILGLLEGLFYKS